MVRVRVTPIINAQNELDQWWLKHLDKHTKQEDGKYMFINHTHKLHYEVEYIEYINLLTTKYNLKDKQLIRSTFDNYEIHIYQEPEAQPEVEPEVGPEAQPEVGIPIDEVHVDTPSEETKQEHHEIPVLHNAYNPRINELKNSIFELKHQIEIYRRELNSLMFHA